MDIEHVIYKCMVDWLRLDDKSLAECMIENRIIAWLMQGRMAV